MRAVWGDRGTGPNVAKLRAGGFDAFYFDIRDATLDGLRAVVADGFVAGVYSVASPSWPETKNLSGPQFATWTSQRLGVILAGQANDPAFPCVCLDIEKDDIRGYVLPALTQWRKHRPQRVTDLTIEGHKGGLFTPADVVSVVARVRYTVPQCYNGPMDETWDSWAMCDDLQAAGFPRASVTPFLDAAHLGEWWQGYAFTQGRLP